MVRDVEVDVERREVRLDVNAKAVEEESSLGVVFGRW